MGKKFRAVFVAIPDSLKKIIDALRGKCFWGWINSTKEQLVRAILFAESIILTVEYNVFYCFYKSKNDFCKSSIICSTVGSISIFPIMAIKEQITYFI
jgi:hypothetical protein